MVAGLQDTAFRLWRSSPPWRFSVIFAAAFTVLSAVYLWNGPPSPVAPPSPPSAPGDPLADARLAAYEVAYAQADKLKELGIRCEQVAEAFGKLSSADRQQGRNPRSPPSRVQAVGGGERCQSLIAASDRHFDALAKAVTAADTNPAAKAVEDAVAAFKVVDADPFDRSRSRYANEKALIEEGRGYAADLTASPGRIGALMQEAERDRQDPSSGSYARLAAASDQIKPLDRGRMTPEQSAVFTQAQQKIRATRDRLSGLSSLLERAERDSGPQARQQLIDPVAALTPFDEALASPEQKQALDRARQVAMPLAWSRLQEGLDTLARAPSPAHYQAVAGLYDLLKRAPPAGLSDDQRRLLERARGAGEALSASDARLEQLLKAARSWQQLGSGSSDDVLAALQAITPLDRQRFLDPPRQPWEQAWRVLGQAEAILRAPQKGLNAATKDKTPICVTSRDGASKGVADGVRNGLRAAGFQVADDVKAAALIADVSIEKVEGPFADASSASGIAGEKALAYVTVSATWTADGSPLFSSTVTGTGKSNSRYDVKDKALVDAARQAVVAFQDLTRK